MSEVQPTDEFPAPSLSFDAGPFQKVGWGQDLSRHNALSSIDGDFDSMLV